MNVLHCRLPACLAAMLLCVPAHADQRVLSVRVDSPPVLDGKADDAVWDAAPEYTVSDAVAGIPMTLRSVHTADEVFFLVGYPDASESREHKTMLWNKESEMYEIGPQREDMFVFKWNMEPDMVDLRVPSVTPYRADIWFWKAHRTDHAGYADDKTQIYTNRPLRRAHKIFADNGQVYYLQRPGDAGAAAYEPILYDHFVGERAPRYELVVPGGSRADVRAKGTWSQGRWTVEFGRALDTGNPDDVRLQPGRSHLFGVSRYEIAGRDSDPSVEQPDYGRGTVGERLFLEFRDAPLVQ